MLKIESRSALDYLFVQIQDLHLIFLAHVQGHMRWNHSLMHTLIRLL